MNRYTMQCQKLGLQPSWSNVYNRVNVNISNEEFGEITSKEVELAQYLDMVHTVKVSNHLYINEHHSFEHIMAAGKVMVETQLNER